MCTVIIYTVLMCFSVLCKKSKHALIEVAAENYSCKILWKHVVMEANKTTACLSDTIIRDDQPVLSRSSVTVNHSVWF